MRSPHAARGAKLRLVHSNPHAIRLPATLRTQPRLPKGQRLRIGAGITKELARYVRRDMADYGVSRPWVVTVALARMFGVELDVTADYQKADDAHATRRTRRTR